MNSQPLEDKEEPEEELTEVAPPSLPPAPADSNVKMIEEVLETLKVRRWNLEKFAVKTTENLRNCGENQRNVVKNNEKLGKCGENHKKNWEIVVKTNQNLRNAVQNHVKPPGEYPENPWNGWEMDNNLM